MNTAHATGRWRDILPALGIEARFLTGKHGPCPMCGGVDRWRFDDKAGRGTWFCSHCGAGDGFKLAQAVTGSPFAEVAARIETLCGAARRPRPERKARDPRADMNAVWRLGGKITPATAAGRYLERRTGLAEFCTDLRAVASLEHWARGARAPTRHPAMIAMVRGEDGKAVNIHRTYLTAGGQKAEVDPVRKLMPGSLPPGSAVRLGACGPILGIAEGIETALSAGVLFGLVVWSALNTQAMMAWRAPPGLAEAVVFGDADKGFAGQRAAYVLAERLSREGLAVRVELPPLGQDWNDVLSARQGIAA